jgi:hypothetical protein
MRVARHRRNFNSWIFVSITVWLVALVAAAVRSTATATAQSSTFVRKVLAPALPESPFPLRFFAGAVKTNSRGEIITGQDDDPVKNLVGAESASRRFCSASTTSTAAPIRARGSIRTIHR